MTTPTTGAFGGTLGVLSLFDLAQMLSLNRATGRLDVVDDGRRGSLYFDQGRVVNALDDEHGEGEIAAYQVFSWREGRFDFHPEPATGSALINDSTDAIMLEAARRMDEAAEASGKTGGETGRLLERQGAVEALREEFGRLANEALQQTAAASGGISVAGLPRLEGPADRVVLRAGEPPRHRRGALWAAGGARLSADDFERLRGELIAASRPCDPAQPDPPAPRRFDLAGAGTLLLEFVQEPGREALWLRRVELPAPSAVATAAAEALRPATEPESVVVIACAPTADSARAWMHAVIAARDRRRPGVALVITDHPVFRHDDASGVVATVSPASSSAAIAALDPETVALDRGAFGSPLVSASLDGVHAWIGCAVGPTAAEAACRWMAAALVGHPALRAWIAMRPVVLVAPGGGGLPARAWTLGEAQRTMLANADAGALADALERPSVTVRTGNTRRAA